MSVKLYVRKTSDAGFSAEYEYDQEIITIGRDPSNSLALQDPNKMVSRHHAQIKRQDDNWFLVDSESRNATFLNEQKLTSNDPVALQSGDCIKVGEFIVEYEYVPETPTPSISETDERTVMLEDPYEAELAELKAVIGKIQTKFQEQDPLDREEAFRFSFGSAFNAESPEMLSLMADAFVPNRAAAPKAAPEPVKEASPVVSEASAVDARLMQRVNMVLDVLLETLLSIFHHTHDFRREFINITLIRSQESLSSMDAAKLREYLFNDAISDTEAERRVNSIKLELDELVLHNKALKRGYKAVIDEGLSNFLQHMDPDQIRNKFANETIGIWPIKFPVKYVPPILKIRVYRAMKEMMREILDGGQVGQDRHILRPIFINAYMERMQTDQIEFTDSHEF